MPDPVQTRPCRAFGFSFHMTPQGPFFNGIPLSSIVQCPKCMSPFSQSHTTCARELFPGLRQKLSLSDPKKNLVSDQSPPTGSWDSLTMIHFPLCSLNPHFPSHSVSACVQRQLATVGKADCVWFSKTGSMFLFCEFPMVPSVARCQAIMKREKHQGTHILGCLLPMILHSLVCIQ